MRNKNEKGKCEIKPKTTLSFFILFSFFLFFPFISLFISDDFSYHYEKYFQINSIYKFHYLITKKGQTLLLQGQKVGDDRRATALSEGDELQGVGELLGAEDRQITRINLFVIIRKDKER